MRKEQDKNQSNLEEKKTKNKNSKKMFGGGYNLLTKTALPKVILLVIVIAVLVAAMFSLIYKGPQTISTNIDPELARAMEYEQVRPGEEKVEINQEQYPEYKDGIYPYVEFDAFFLRDLDGDGYAESVRGTCREIGKTDTLYINLNVLTEGHLEEGKITINSDKNYCLQTSIVKDNEIKENYIGTDTREILFENISNGTQKLLTGVINSSIGDNIDNYSKLNSITFSGKHVKDNGDSVYIEKTVSFNIDWYGSVHATISSVYVENDIKNAVLDEESQGLKLNFKISVCENQDQLILKRSHLEGTMATLNGYAPKKVQIKNEDVSFEYNEETRKFIAQKDAELKESRVTKNAYDKAYTRKIKDNEYLYDRYNNYELEVIYPKEAYESLDENTIQLQIPVKAYYEGYNNKNDEFDDPYVSNIARQTVVVHYGKPQGFLAILDVYVEDTYKEKPLEIYNGVSEQIEEDNYSVKWELRTGIVDEPVEIMMKEAEEDKFIKADSNKESMDDVTNFTGIYFSSYNPFNALGADGWIKVYDDETGMLLKTFTASEFYRFTKSNPYRYEMPVKHIRIETSNISGNKTLYINHIKSLDDEAITSKYGREEFDNLKYVQSTLTGHIGEKNINTASDTSPYQEPKSIAYISTNPGKISTYGTYNNMKINIETTNNYTKRKWSNGSFLIKIPKDIIDLKINSVNVNNDNVHILSYEQYEENGENFIRIITENNIESTYTITIDCNMTPDPGTPTVTKEIELYASNESLKNYHSPSQDIYDVNRNLNIEENVEKDVTNFSFISPNSLITAQTASGFDSKDSIAIAPQVAFITKEQRKANIKIDITNNYKNTVSEVKVLGKIPFTNNKYAVNGGDMGSNYNTTMSSPGIILPEELDGIVKVYYSTNENPDTDLSKNENNWEETPDNFENVRSFLIDFQSKIFATQERYSVNYEINIPPNLQYNQVSYSHHAVYFCLDTDQGKYRTRTEPNKLGFMVVRRHNLEITKYQINTLKPIPGAIYGVQEEGKDEIRTNVTQEDGTLLLENLYVERTYSIKEIKSPEEYKLSEEIVKFTTVESDNGDIEVNVISNNAKNSNIIQAQEDELAKVQIEVEDEARAKLKIVKLEEGSDKSIQGINFKIYGEGLPENGKFATTDKNGEINLKGLYIGEEYEYTLQEIKATGYYLADPIKFTIINTDGEYSINFIEGGEKIRENLVSKIDEIPMITIKVNNEKIPTYTLEITKREKIIENTVTEDEITAQEGTSENAEIKYLEGAKFKLYKGTKEIGTYQTNGDGKIVIPDLYQYIEEKKVDQTYTLKEILAPDGYAKVKDIIFRVEKIGDKLEFKEELQEGQTAKKYQVVGDTVKVIVEDSPSFKLIKRDGETQGTLQNVKFAIYNVDDGEVPATNSKGEIIGTKEVINGKEYYTVSTNENGELTADLPEGLYKAVEVEAPDKYDIENKVYYFGIGASREGKSTLEKEWEIEKEGVNIVNFINLGQDDGYIVVGKKTDGSISRAVLMKYSTEGIEEWENEIGVTKASSIEKIILTSDGGFLVQGNFSDTELTLDENNVLRNAGASDIMIIKYTREGAIEWSTSIGGSSDEYIDTIEQTSDGGFVIRGYYKSATITLNDENILTYNSKEDSYAGNLMIIKYKKLETEEGKYELDWAKSLIRKDDHGDDCIKSITETKDKGFMVICEVHEKFTLSNGQVFTNIGGEKNASYKDSLLVKYDSNGEIEWANIIGGTEPGSVNIYFVNEDENENYIVWGFNTTGEIILDDKHTLMNDSAFIINYNSVGKVEWIKRVDSLEKVTKDFIYATSDEGLIIGGYFKGEQLQLDDEHIIQGRGSNNDVGIIIKYNKEGNIDWAKSIINRNSNGVIDGSVRIIESIYESHEGDYIVAGYFDGNQIVLDNQHKLEAGIWGSGGYCMIKFDSNGEIKDAIEIPRIQSNCKINQLIDGSYMIQQTIESNNQIMKFSENLEIEYLLKGNFYNLKELATGKYLAICNSKLVKYREIASQEIVIKKENLIDRGNINSILDTSDGGSIIVGEYSSEIKLDDEHRYTSAGDYDGIVVKYGRDNNIEWSVSIGGSSVETINAVIETIDGGYICGGYFASAEIILDENNKLVNAGSTSGSARVDAMLIKYNRNGEIEWTKLIGGTGYEQIDKMITTSDDGYIVAGYCADGDVILDDEHIIHAANGRGERGTYGMVIKYDSNNQIEWVKETDLMETYELVTTKENNIFVVGYNYSHDWKAAGEVIKFNENGEKLWLNEIYGYGEVKPGYPPPYDRGYDYATNIIATDDGGCIVGCRFSSEKIVIGNQTFTNKNSNGTSDVLLIKYDENGIVKWAQQYGNYNGDSISFLTQTSDGGFLLELFDDVPIELGEKILGSNILIKYDSNDQIEWVDNIKQGAGNLKEIAKNSYRGISGGDVIKINIGMGVPEIQELIVENNIKQLKITTEVEEINGNKGGQISGEGKDSFRTVKYGETYGEGDDYIVMTPNAGYELLKVTINGERTENFELQADGSYKLKPLTNITENQHIVVTYAKSNTKLVINKLDSDGETPLAGAKFKIEQIDERTVGEDVIGEMQSNGQEYIKTNTDAEIKGVLGQMQNNGPIHAIPDTTKEMTQKIGQKQDGTTGYIFKYDEEKGTYEPTNGGKQNNINTIAHSYFEINLQEYTGKVLTVVINAEASSESSDYGYATITNSTTMPELQSSNTEENGQFMRISSTASGTYTSKMLEGGNIYYLHLGYKKDYSQDDKDDTIVINSIKLYETNTASYYFEKDESTNKYTSNNQGKSGTIASSYIPINLTEYTGKKVAVVVNAEISSVYGNSAYATITKSIQKPSSYNSGTGVLNNYGRIAPKNYTVYINGGEQYYLHFVYNKGSSSSTQVEGVTDTFTINSINIYETKVDIYDFQPVEIKNGDEVIGKKYVSTNKGLENTEASSYVTIDLKGLSGKYKVIVNAQISSEDKYDYGYALIKNNATRPTYSSGNFMYISGITSNVTMPKDYTTEVTGGSLYYLHFVYYKNSSKNDGTDEFTINSIKVVPYDESLYTTEVVTDEKGQAFTDLPITPTAKYSITEIEAPEGYEISNSRVVTIGEENEVTIINTKKPKLVVHHYKEGTGIDGIPAVPVADDENYVGKMGEKYETEPKVTLERYELVKDTQTDEYKIPTNAKGTYSPELLNEQGEIEVTYYYTNRKIPLVVHHYIEGSTIPVPLKDGEATDINLQGNENDEYNTSAIPAESLDEKYELVETPENSTGTYQYPKVEVIYEYRLKTYEITTKVQLHAESDEFEEEIYVAGGKIDGEGEKPYETVEYGENSQKPIVAIPNEDYQVDSIKINGQEVEESKYTVEENKNIRLHSIENIKENQEVVVTFGKMSTKVTVHHYIYDKDEQIETQEGVPLKNGEIAKDEIKEGRIGDMYATKPVDNLSSKYKIYQTPSNSSGLMEKDPIDVTYYYIEKDVPVLIEITKEGSNKITAKEQEVDYKIKYTATIEKYIGNTIVTITDTLPYKLNTEEMANRKNNEGVDTSSNKWLEETLNGGVYDEKMKKIVWTENIDITNIDEDSSDGITVTEDGESRVITVEKNISVIFKDINISLPSFTNNVEGKIEINGIEEAVEQATHTTQTEFIKNIKVTKHWEHGLSTHDIPSKIKVIIKNGENEVDSAILSNENNWTHLFLGLPRYNAETGEEILYTVDEEEVDGQSLQYYERKEDVAKL